MAICLSTVYSLHSLFLSVGLISIYYLLWLARVTSRLLQLSSLWSCFEKVSDNQSQSRNHLNFAHSARWKFQVVRHTQDSAAPSWAPPMGQPAQRGFNSNHVQAPLHLYSEAQRRNSSWILWLYINLSDCIHLHLDRFFFPILIFFKSHLASFFRVLRLFCAPAPSAFELKMFGAWSSMSLFFRQPIVLDKAGLVPKSPWKPIKWRRSLFW